MGFLIIPHERWTLRSPLSPSEALTRLAGQVEPRKLRLPWEQCDSPFEGQVEDRRFELTRVHGWRNAGLPVIVGEAYDDPTGSRFEITFRIRKELLAFLALGVLLLGWTALHERSGLLYGFIFMAIVALATRFTFLPEVRRSKVMLAQALGAPRQSVRAPVPGPTSWLDPDGD